jgi:hypothetical protein
MTRDAKESLTALGAVLAVTGFACLWLLLTPEDMEIPNWVLWAGLGINIATVIHHVVKRRRSSSEKPPVR